VQNDRPIQKRGKKEKKKRGGKEGQKKKNHSVSSSRDQAGPSSLIFQLAFFAETSDSIRKKEGGEGKRRRSECMNVFVPDITLIVFISPHPKHRGGGRGKGGNRKEGGEGERKRLGAPAYLFVIQQQPY